MGGSNDPSNLIELSVLDHAIAHKKLWEKYGKVEDKIAWMCLSGQIDNAEAIRLAGIAANTGKIASKETKEKMSISQTGQKRTDQTKKNISNALKGKPKSKQHIINMCGARPHVNQTGSNNNNAKKIKTPYGVFNSISECVKYMQKSINREDKHIRYIINKHLINHAKDWSLF
jgi:hypothetical protein